MMKDLIKIFPPLGTSSAFPTMNSIYKNNAIPTPVKRTSHKGNVCTV